MVRATRDFYDLDVAYGLDSLREGFVEELSVPELAEDSQTEGVHVPFRRQSNYVLRTAVQIYDLNALIAQRFDKLWLAFIASMAEAELSLVINSPTVKLAVLYTALGKTISTSHTSDSKRVSIATDHLLHFLIRKFFNESLMSQGRAHQSEEKTYRL